MRYLYSFTDSCPAGDSGSISVTSNEDVPGEIVSAGFDVGFSGGSLSIRSFTPVSVATHDGVGFGIKRWDLNVFNPDTENNHNFTLTVVVE